MHTSDTIRFLIENREVLITFIIALIAVIKLTTWGKSQASALDAVVGVIEQLGLGNAKSAVSNAAGDLSSGAQDAISDSVAKADPKQTQPSLVTRILREVFRGI